MATREQQARIFNEAIVQGLSEDQALAAAGITNPNEFTYGYNTGKLEPAQLGPPKRPNEVIVPPGASIDYGDDDEDRQFVTRPVSSQTTSTSQTTVTGGSVRTTTVTPTTYRDTPQSQALRGQADGLQAQKEARSAELRAQGKTGAEVLRDPEYRRLSQEQQAASSAAQDAKAVDQAGTVSVTTSPGQGSEFARTPDSGYLTSGTTGVDPYANESEIATGPDGSDLPENRSAENINDISYGEGGGFVYDDNGELIPADSADAEAILAEQDRVKYDTPPQVGGRFTEVYDPETGRWNVENLDTGEIIATGLTQQEAIIAAQDASTGGTGYPPGTGADTADPGLTPAQITEQQQSAADKEAALARARAQATLSAQQGQADQGDWRVKLRLAPGATYLYESPEAGILAPLSTRSGTGGVIFPYTPRIDFSYNARYQSYDLTHSNYRGYFYSGSHVEAVTLTADFTAQDSAEAAYLLAVIHFFRSVTKMFYGQDDAFAGAPPPLVYLQGLGQYQFALHPCVVSQFNYNLPSDVDYIRANSPTINGTNLLAKRTRGPGVPTDPFTSAWSRIQNVLKPQNVNKGAVPLGGVTQVPTFGTDRPTYVPTKIAITLTLLPMQNRQQISRQFSLKGYANGNLLRGPSDQPGAFW